MCAAERATCQAGSWGVGAGREGEGLGLHTIVQNIHVQLVVQLHNYVHLNYCCIYMDMRESKVHVNDRCRIKKEASKAPPYL